MVLHTRWFWLPVAMIGLAGPAHAEFPVAVNGTVGLGLGASWTGGQAIGPLVALAAGQLARRQRPGRALTLTYQGVAVGAPGSFIPEYEGPTGTVYTALLLGIEHSRPGNGPRGYVEASAGLGWVRTELRREERHSIGPALSGSAGVRIISEEGGVGLLAGVRTSHVFTGATHVHSLVVLQLGLTVRPN